MPKSPPSFDFFPGDWFGGTRYLPLIARAAYMELLCHQWQNRTVPNSAQFRQALWGVPADTEQFIWGLIRDKFEIISEDNGSELINRRMFYEAKQGGGGSQSYDEVVEAWKNRKEINKENGSKAKRKRKQVACKSLSESVANREGGSRKDPSSLEIGKTVTPSESPTPTTTRDNFAQFFSLYPIKCDEHFSRIAWGFLNAADQLAAIDGADRYAKSTTPFKMNPVKFIEGRRWLDDPQTWDREPVQKQLNRDQESRELKEIFDGFE